MPSESRVAPGVEDRVRRVWPVCRRQYWVLLVPMEERLVVLGCCHDVGCDASAGAGAA